MDLKKLNKQKLQLLESCYYAILHAESKKIKQALKAHYANDAWLEEECTVRQPTLGIIVTGISHELVINPKLTKGVNCLPDDFNH